VTEEYKTIDGRYKGFLVFALGFSPVAYEGGEYSMSTTLNNDVATKNGDQELD